MDPEDAKQLPGVASINMQHVGSSCLLYFDNSFCQYDVTGVCSGHQMMFR
ncbi:hypothetical protein ABVT39_017758 [Epinephelus coioides]